MKPSRLPPRQSLSLSLGINLLYVCVNILSFFLYRSYWFVFLTVYYVILASMRFLLLRYAEDTRMPQDILSQYRRTRLCAAILLSINFVLSGTVLMILFKDKGFVYPGVLIYAAATYTFYLTVHAIVNMVRYRRHNSPVITMSKAISLSHALVSMLFLETAMLSQFGTDMDEETKRIMIAATGGAVSVIVIALAVQLIARCSKEIKVLRSL